LGNGTDAKIKASDLTFPYSALRDGLLRLQAHTNMFVFTITNGNKCGADATMLHLFIAKRLGDHVGQNG